MERNFEEQFADIIRKYRETQFQAVQESLDVSANYMVARLKEATPIGSGPIHFKDQWDVKRNYKNVRYIGNTKMTKETPNFKSIPLSSAIEFGKNKKPFIARTYKTYENEVFNIFKIELERRI